MRGILLTDMSVQDLRETISVLNNNKNVIKWPKHKCVEWLNRKHINEINVGDFCRFLLKVVVGKTADGFPVGLSYAKMAKIVNRHFPRSVVDEGHFRWYATTMRSSGEMIPVYREKKQ